MTSADASTAEPRREQAFAASLRGVFLTRFRAAALLAIALLPVGIGLDLLYAPHKLGELLALRLAFATLCGALYGLSFVPRLKERGSLLGMVLAITLAVGIELAGAVAGGAEQPYWAGQGVLLVAVGMIFPWSALQMALVCAAVVAIHGAFAVGLGALEGHLRSTVNHLYFLGNTAVVAVVATYFMRRLSRREFDARSDLEARTEELRDATANLRATVDKLQELDRLKTQLFANVSHELRTPLTVVIAVLDELEGVEHVDVLRANAQTLLQLINDLLDMAELDAGKAEVRAAPLDLRHLVESAVAAFVPMAERRGVALVAEAADAPHLLADAEKLETILRNLVSNAVKFTREGGTVTVRARAEDAWACLEVSDTGVGIRPEDQPAIFDRFTRGASASAGVRGSGIGLALVKELTTLHGGEVTVQSAPGQGSTFCVRVPRAQVNGTAANNLWHASTLRAQIVAEPAEPPAQSAPPDAPRVLVVEDHPDLRSFLVRYLGAHFQVVHASDVEQALGHIAHALPDVVVSDVMLPGRSGTDLVRALKRDVRTADIPILLLTAQRGAAAAVEGLGGGADDFVQKPFSPRELLARIRAHLRARDLNRELLHSQKMALLGTLTAGLAHEVRNPINAIVNGLPLVARALPHTGADAEVSREMLGIVEDATRRIRRIVDDLLGFSRRGANDPSSWSPDAGVQTALKLLEHRVNGRTVHTDLGRGVQVRGFPDRLDQIVVNLIDNALRSTGPDGHVWIRTVPAAGGVRVEVKDDGPGIERELQGRIFDPFFTTREVGSGTGLGLHLSRQIAQAHGGTLEVESNPGEGATFTLFIPSGPEDERHPA